MNEKTFETTDTKTIHLKCNCVDVFIVIGRRKSFQISISLSAPPGFRILVETISTLFEKVKKEKIDDKNFCSEDADGKMVDFRGGSLTFTVMLKFVEGSINSLNDKLW